MAQQGLPAGGTGFIATIPSERHEGEFYPYAITCKHVIRGGAASPIMRLNTRSGDVEALPLAPADWYDHPDDDLSVAMVRLDFARYEIARVDASDTFLTPAELDAYNIGIGDDTFTVGRFITHDGGEINKPCARFGNISMMPSVVNFEGHEQECFMVETRALKGGSGSPVFVHFMFDPSFRRKPGLPEPERRQNTWLLGLSFADFPYQEDVVTREGKETDYLAESNSGQMAVIPAWRILDFILNDERFVT